LEKTWGSKFLREDARRGRKDKAALSRRAAPEFFQAINPEKVAGWKQL
jgi:hypothetical protein